MACGDDTEPETHCVALGEGSFCAGVAQTDLGSGTWYTDDTGEVSCASVLYVRSGATNGTGSQQAPFGDLPEAAVAAGAAGPGVCIALAEGQYQGRALPQGVSLLGRGAARSRVTGSVAGEAALTVSGTGVLVRGVRLSGEGVGLAVRDATEVQVSSVLVDGVRSAGISILRSASVTIEQVRVTGVAPAGDIVGDVGVGVFVEQGHSIHVLRSLVEGCQGSGLIHYGDDLSVEQSIIRRNLEYGIAATCWESPCVPPPTITLQSSFLEDNRGVSLWLSEVVAVVEGVTVRGTARDAYGYSRSLEGVALPDLQVVSSTFEAGEDLGILLHGSSAVIRQSAVRGHGGRGIWIQNVTGSWGPIVDITGTEVSGNHQVGIGILGSCDVTVADSDVIETRLGSQITDTGTIHQGDGVQALPGSTVTVDAVQFQGNARQSILADAVTRLVVSNSDFRDEAAEPIAVQNVGVDDISNATNVEYTNNQGIGGSAVEPMIPPDPFDRDTAEISAATPNLL